MEVNMDLRYNRTMDPDMALSGGPGLDVILVLSGKQVASISPFLTILMSSELPFTTTHEPFCLFPYCFSPIHLLIIMAPTCASGRPVDASGRPDCEDSGSHAGVFYLP